MPDARLLVVGIAARIFDHGQHVIGVKNRKLLLQAQRRAAFAQHAHAKRVKRANHHLARSFGAIAPQRLREQFFGPLAHLRSGFVGKRDRSNARRRHTALNQPCNLVRNHPRLARARPSQHQTRPMQKIHSLLLGNIQTGGRHV